MTLPSSGAISLNDVNVELGNSATAQISMNDAAVRGLFGVASGTIQMSNGYGKSNTFAFTISSTQVDANLRTLAVAAGWDQSTAVEATIGSGVNINGSVAANSTAALTIDGSWPGGVTLINNGYIVGRGGAGNNGNVGPYIAAQAGGRALSASVAVTIDNQGTIAGGGGGGANSYSTNYCRECSMGEDSGCAYMGGNGGGGGRSNTSYTAAGGTAATNNGQTGNNGTAGTFSAAGAGGAQKCSSSCGQCTCTVCNLAAGNGGDWGTAGSNLPQNANWYGGAAGQAVNGNAYITWTNTGTRLGTIV